MTDWKSLGLSVDIPLESQIPQIICTYIVGQLTVTFFLAGCFSQLNVCYRSNLISGFFFTYVDSDSDFVFFCTITKSCDKNYDMFHSD